MKTADKKLAFIRLRAEGKSYETIAKELEISKPTCCNWNKELSDKITALKQEQLEELYEAFHMAKAARIEHLGEQLNAIDAAISKKDLTEIPADKLLELRLKYQKALKDEYLEPLDAGEDTTKGILAEVRKLFIEAKQGKYTPAEIGAQMNLLEKRKELAERAQEDDNWGFLNRALGDAVKGL